MKCTALLVASLFLVTPMVAQDQTNRPAATVPFKWVNEVPKSIKADPALIHGKFFSKANQTNVGYFVAYPRGYDAPENKNRRYPVIFYLHGGGQGSEGRGVQIYPELRPMLTSEAYPPAFLVCVNGGKRTYYDTPDSKGETAFIELIEHINKTYRTIADRGGRVMLGHSMGGRGTGRIIFKYPELIGTGIAMSGGHQREKPRAEAAGQEAGEDTVTDPKNNTYDNATRYAQRTTRPEIRLMVVVGDKDANYRPNLDWDAHLTQLKIAHELVVVPGSGHGINWKTANTDRRIYDFITDNLKHFSKKD